MRFETTELHKLLLKLSFLYHLSWKKQDLLVATARSTHRYF